MIRFQDRLVVQQFKTRSSDRTWSLREVIDKVLPDLYRTVDLAVTPEARYVLVTDGRMGSWRGAMEFFNSLGHREPPNSPLHALDDTQELRFFGWGKCTRKNLFIEICDAIRARARGKPEPLLVTRRKVWHLLGRFRIVTTPPADRAEHSLIAMLRAFVPDDAAAQAASNAIIVKLLRLSKRGNAVFTPEELLEGVGIDPEQFIGREPLREAVKQFVRRESETLVGYRPELSVRSPYAWQGSANVLAFRGPVEVGKSWALASLAQSEDPSRSLRAFGRATGNIEADLERLVKAIHEDLLGSPLVTSLDSARELAAELTWDTNPWVIACIDDVTFGDVQRLSEMALDRYGIRVAVSIADTQGSRESLERLNIHVVEVQEFTDEELAEFLRRHGRRFRDVPEDLLEQMHRPLRAELYVRSTPDSWHPTNEYAFFDALWQSTLTAPEQHGLAALGESALLDEKTAWQGGDARALGLSSLDLSRLESTGWLRRESGKLTFAHNRLLNWAVAESVVERHGADVDALASHIALAARFDTASSPPYLGYVPMDALWLFVRQATSSGHVAGLLRRLEAEESPRTDILYDELLPTLGESIIDGLLERARNASPEDEWRVELDIWHALRRILAGGRSDAPVITAALTSGRPILERIGVRLALVFPEGKFAPALWPTYVRLKVTPEMPGEEHDTGAAMHNSELVWRRQRAFAALTKAAVRNLSWLRELIGNEREHLTDAVWLLSNMDTEAGRATWFDVKETILLNPPQGDERALLHCFRTFRDEAEIPRILAIIERRADKFVVATAFATLSVLAPDLALKYLPTIDPVNLAFTRGWWLPWLMLRRPEATVDTLKSFIESTHPAVPYAAQWFAGHEEYLAPVLAAAFLSWLGDELPLYLSSREEGRHPRLGDVVELLSNAGAVELLELYGDAGAGLRSDVARLCEFWSASSEGHLRYYLESAVRLLRLLSQDAFCKFVSQDFETRGVKGSRAIWLIPCDSPSIRSRLRAISESAEPSTGGAAKFAIRALAALGDEAGVVRGSLKGDDRIDPDVVTLLREHAPAMQKKALVGAEEMLRSPDPAARTRAVAVIGLSGRAEFLPVVTEIARVAPRDSRLRTVALYAVAGLIDGEPVDQSLGDFDDWLTNHQIIGWLLRECRTESALAKLEELIYSSPEFDSTSFDDVAVEAIDDSPRGERIAEFEWRRLQRMPIEWWHQNWIDQLVPRIKDPGLRTKVWREARRGFDPSVMRALAYFDRASAVDETLAFLKSESRYREGGVPLLIEIDPAGAVPLLIDHAREDRSAKVRAAIGRALRRVPNRDEVVEPIRRLLAAPESEDRAAGCELAGWIPEVEEWRISQRASEDLARRVQERALSALSRRRLLLHAQGLLTAFHGSTGFGAWKIADVLVRTHDAEVLGSEGDPLCIWPALEEKSLALRTAVYDLLEKRRKEISRSEDWESRRDDD